MNFSTNYAAAKLNQSTLTKIKARWRTRRAFLLIASELLAARCRIDPGGSVELRPDLNAHLATILIGHSAISVKALGAAADVRRLGPATWARGLRTTRLSGFSNCEIPLDGPEGAEFTGHTMDFLAVPLPLFQSPSASIRSVLQIVLSRLAIFHRAIDCVKAWLRFRPNSFAIGRSAMS